MKLDEALRYATDTALLENGNVLNRTGELYNEYFGKKRCFLVADENTYAAAGSRVEEHLQEAGVQMAEPLVYPGSPVLPPDYGLIQEIRGEIDRRNAIPVAVGSGTINDLVKVAAYENDLKYMVVATAASVDGYSAPGASILKNGFKNSIYCRAPYVIVADSEVLRKAPQSMTAAGYADLASKFPAGADWIIADALGEDPIDDVCWRMVQTSLDDWLSDPEGISDGNPQSIASVFYGLTMTGISMQRLRKSRPASGAEHLMSHIWEMRHLSYEGRPVSHGFKVGVATLATTALMERIFDRNGSDIDIEALTTRRSSWEEEQAQIEAAFGGTPIIQDVIQESRAKYADADRYRQRLQVAVSGFDEISGRIKSQLLQYPELKQRLRKAGAPVRPEDIGIEKPDVNEIYRLARLIRNRYTCLDFAYDIGILDACIDEVIGSDTYLT